MNKEGPRCNRDIVGVQQVRLVDENGHMIGVVSINDAIRMSSERRLDLVEISPMATPPVCKMMNYGKYRYEMQKKAQIAKKKQKIVETKEIKIRPTIADGDYNIKLRKAIAFLKDGDKVRVSLQFRGREVVHNEIGFALMNRFKGDIAEFGKIDVEPKMEGKQIFMMISHK